MISLNQPIGHLGTVESQWTCIHQNDKNKTFLNVIPISSSPYHPMFGPSFGELVVVKLKPANNARYFFPPG